MGSIRKVFEELMDKRSLFIKVLIFLGVFVVLAGSITKVNAQRAIMGQLSKQEIQQIGESVFENGCASKDENLIAWNEGEDFLSLGILYGSRRIAGSFLREVS